MRVPDFYIVGAPKCGTTALWEYLSQHPDVHLGTKKEPHYFSPEFRPRNPMDRQTYLELFAGAAPHQKLGEGSVFYLYSQTSARNIYRENPEARIVIMLRDPVAMTHALHGEMCLWPGQETIHRFTDALSAESERKKGRLLPGDLRIPQEWLYYREVGRYAEQVQRYFEVFGRERVLILWFEDFNANTPGLYRTVCELIGIDPNHQPEFERHNTARHYRFPILGRTMQAISQNPPAILRKLIANDERRRRLFRPLWRLNLAGGRREALDPAVAASLRAEFAPDVRSLAELTGRDLGHWMDSAGGVR